MSNITYLVSSLADDIAPFSWNCRSILRNGIRSLVEFSSRYPVKLAGLPLGVCPYDLAAVRSEETSSGDGSEIAVGHVDHLLFDVEALVVVLDQSAARGVLKLGHSVVDHDGVFIVWGALGVNSINIHFGINLTNFWAYFGRLFGQWGY